MQICYRCHEYHDDKQDICYFCKQDSLIDAEIPEELEDQCNDSITTDAENLN